MGNVVLAYWNRLVNWLTPPTNTEEDNRRANLLLKVAMAMFATDLLGFTIALLEPNNEFNVTIGFYGPVTIVILLFFLILRKGKIRLAGWFMVLFSWAIVAIATLFFGGFHSQIPVVFVVAIMFMGSFLGSRQAVLLTVITIFFLGIVAFLEASNNMPHQFGPEYSPINAWGALCVALMLMSVLLHNLISSIKENEERHQLALRGSAAGLWDWDILRNEVYYAPGFKAMLGYSVEDFPYDLFSFDHAIHPDDLPTKKLALDSHLHSYTKGYAVQCRLKTKFGDYKWFDIRGEALRNKQGKHYRMVGSIVDISDRKHAEEAVVLKNEQLVKINQELDRFVYSASHDLRAPISSLLGLIEIAHLERSSEEMKRILEMQKISLVKMDNFISDIVNYSRNERLDLEIERIDFRTLIDGVYEQFQYLDKSASIEKRIAIDTDIIFHSDKKRLIVMLSNLISNALQFSDFSKIEKFIETRVVKSSDGVMVHVKDTGEGIDARYIPKIFDMFFRASERSSGSGIGLYIVKEVVQKLSGTVEVRSVKYEGSEFVIYLPDLKQ